MRIRLTCRVAVIALAIASCAGAQTRRNEQTISKYDRFRDVTTLSTAAITPRPNLMISVSASYPGKTRPASIDSVRVLFLGSPLFWPTLDAAQTVSVIVDDENPVAYSAEYSSTFQESGTVNTVYALTWSVSDLRRVACGKRVDMKVAQREMQIATPDLRKMKALLTAIGGKCS
jgi:hypothetical protein